MIRYSYRFVWGRCVRERTHRQIRFSPKLWDKTSAVQFLQSLQSRCVMEMDAMFMSAISYSFFVIYLSKWCTTQLNKTNSLLKPKLDNVYNINNGNYSITLDYIDVRNVRLVQFIIQTDKCTPYILRIHKKIQQDATTYQNFIIPYLYKAQHVSGYTLPIIRSLKLHRQPLVFYTWKVVWRVDCLTCR
jgi:hypothetical protein